MTKSAEDNLHHRPLLQILGGRVPLSPRDLRPWMRGFTCHCSWASSEEAEESKLAAVAAMSSRERATSRTYSCKLHSARARPRRCRYQACLPRRRVSSPQDGTHATADVASLPVSQSAVTVTHDYTNVDLGLVHRRTALQYDVIRPHYASYRIETTRFSS